ncbi:MAG: glycosyltransferase [Alphaproteobacteria bacterium]
MTLDASVVLVSDYKAGDEKSWNDVRKALRGLASQYTSGAFEVLLVENERYLERLPPDLEYIVPGLRIVPSCRTSSYGLKNEGVRAAKAATVCLIDADCVPAESWIGSCLQAFERRPDAAVVSGLTRYPGRTLTERCLALLLRSYVDDGRRCDIVRISNNNAAYRRDAYLAAPLPEDEGAFASRLQAQAILRSGGALLFEPGMVVIHDFEGWDMERDARAAMAHGLITVRRRDPSIPFSWVVRLGEAGIPIFYAGRVLISLWKCVTVARHYDVKPWQVPYAMLLALVVHAMEVPGALAALRDRTIGQTVYR